MNLRRKSTTQFDREKLEATIERYAPIVEELNTTRAAIKAKIEREDMERFRREVGPGLIADYLAGVGRRDLATRYGMHGGQVNRIINEGTTEEQRHRVWCLHQSRREKSSRERKRKERHGIAGKS